MAICCKTCGIQIKNANIVCPFCDSNLQKQNDIKENFIITPKLNELFEEEKVNIKFNTRSIINDIDAEISSDDENLQIQEAKKKEQYLKSDITKNNINRINEIIKFYNDQLDDYKNQDKKNLETKSISQLQKYVADFNDVVNMCNKYQKIISNGIIKNNILSTIKNYNKEIHYIKKYFILPLYDSEDLLNGSKMAKNFIYLISLILGFFLIAKIPLLEKPYEFILAFLKHPMPINTNLKYGNIYTLVAVPFAIWFTNIMFTFYVSCTIKNKNFQVDKDKSYEAILMFTLVGFFAATYHPSIAILYNLFFMIYVIYITILNVKTKKRGLNWFFVKIASIILAIVLETNLYLFLK